MSNIQALSCLTPSTVTFGLEGLKIYYAFPALQINQVLSDPTDGTFNPLRFKKPHNFSIRHEDCIISLGEQVRFVRLSEETKLKPIEYLAGWANNLGIVDLYVQEKQVYLLLDIPTLLQRTQAGNDHE